MIEKMTTSTTRIKEPLSSEKGSHQKRSITVPAQVGWTGKIDDDTRFLQKRKKSH
ncbi:MAG: hypothetical protein ACFCUM_09565 [Bacteroidales bacterium]